MTKWTRIWYQIPILSVRVSKWWYEKKFFTEFYA